MLSREPAGHNWAAAVAAVPETKIVAVFDATAETRDAFVACWSAPDDPITPFGDYAQMLRVVRPDILCVATRQTQHARQIEQATAAGVRGILCDKPLATSLAEVDRIMAACAASAASAPARVPLAFGLDRRWTRRYRWARELVAQGAVGRVTTVLAYGLLNLIHHGCHWYDMALALADATNGSGDPEIAWVCGLVDDVTSEPPDSLRRLDPAGRAQIGLSNGVTIYVTPDGKPGPAFEVLGDRGRLLLLNDARDAMLWQSERPSGPLRPQQLDVPETPASWDAGPAAVADLVTAIRTGGTTACDLAEARRASEIGFAIHASSAAGGRRLSLAEVDRTLRVSSLPWGNE